MEDLKLIIFDLDGTLIDAYEAIGKSLNYVFSEFGLKLQKLNLIRKLVGWGDINLLKPFVAPQDLKFALSLYRNHHKDSLLKYSRLYPYARGILRQLKKEGYKLAVASNRPSRFSRILLKHLGIDVFFDYVLCADQAKRGKPYPDMLNKIVRRFAFKKTQVLYVGDMVIDAQAGRRAHIRTVIVTSGSSSSSDIRKEHPFKVISGINRLRGLI